MAQLALAAPFRSHSPESALAAPTNCPAGSGRSRPVRGTHREPIGGSEMWLNASCDFTEETEPTYVLCAGVMRMTILLENVVLGLHPGPRRTGTAHAPFVSAAPRRCMRTGGSACSVQYRRTRAACCLGRIRFVG
jgi:hypothetical protein